MKTNTFKTFIEENYYDSICTRLNGFISTHPSFIREKINASVNVHHPELEDFTIEAVYIESGNDNNIEFDIVCNCNVNYEYVEYHGKYKNHDSDCMSDVWVVVHGRTSLSNLKKIYFYGAEEYVKNAIHKPLNGDMVPIIRSSEYAQYAIDIIRKYYGQDYDLTVPINIKELANKMGLEVKHLKPEFSFKKNEAIFGQIYFEKTHTQIYNKETDTMVDITIPANTIVYDPSCHSVYSFGSEAITIAHECVHYELHKKAYLFAKFINNGNISCISCMNGGKVDGIAETDVNESFMEAQANGIAPFLVMPEESFKKRAEELYKEYSSSMQDPIEFIDRMISDLRNEYRVTIPAVKKRLRELGYLRNVSVFEWDKTNKKYIDAYAYQAGSLANDETFSITFDDYQKALDNPNSQLLAVMFNKDFIFVSNHIVFNDEKYVIKDDNDDYVLTEYAKRHLDECALKFKVKNNVTLLSKKSIGTFCYLCKGIADDMSFDLLVQQDSKVLLNPNIKDLRLRHENAQKQVIRIIEDSESLSDCINKLSAIYEYIPKEFDSHGINATTYSRYVNGKVDKVDIRKAICLCHAFKFTFNVSDAFIKRFSNTGLSTDDEGKALFLVLTSMRNSKLKDINIYLTNQGFEPLAVIKE